MKNYYSILGVSESASFKEIKTAYRKLAFELHPDLNPISTDNKNFSEISEAYRILKDPLRRARYNAVLNKKSDSKRYDRWERKTQKSASKARNRKHYSPENEKSGSKSTWFWSILELAFEILTVFFN